jgi:ribonucleoside-diphosphate reductase alpha chain
LKKNTGKEEMRARDLFFAMWTSIYLWNVFRKRRLWTLMCPNECPVVWCVWRRIWSIVHHMKSWKGRKNHQSAWIVGKNPRIANWNWNAICCIKMRQPKIKSKKFRYYSFFKLCTEIMEYF